MTTIHDRIPGTVAGPGEPNHQVELAIGGMTCASCAARIEKKLNRLEGVNTSVNYATERARVSYVDGVTPEDLTRSRWPPCASGWPSVPPSVPHSPPRSLC